MNPGDMIFVLCEVVAAEGDGVLRVAVKNSMGEPQVLIDKDTVTMRATL